MQIKEVSKIGNRGTLFTFEDDTAVYLIHSDEKWFLCDTHLGPQSMEFIQKHISMQSNTKDIIVFNTHSDWDHIWGNCVFQGGIIIGHEMCRSRMKEIGKFDLERLTEYHCGSIKLVLPNVTFSERLTFAEDDIEFIYAPGHTVDSSVCFDRQDSVLFVGDLVEDPIPYLDFIDLETYSKTLEFIKNFPAKIKISAHSGIIDHGLIDRNIAYIQKVLHGNSIDPSVYQGCLHVHNFNINNRLFVKYESMVREKLKKDFDYPSFKSNFQNLGKISYEDLQDALERYFKQL